jgi:hypothetical protein
LRPFLVDLLNAYASLHTCNSLNVIGCDFNLPILRTTAYADLQLLSNGACEFAVRVLSLFMGFVSHASGSTCPFPSENQPECAPDPAQGFLRDKADQLPLRPQPTVLRMQPPAFFPRTSKTLSSFRPYKSAAIFSENRHPWRSTHGEFLNVKSYLPYTGVN